ncbi:MAG: transcription elongation factor GreB [Bdellovibrionota bacterium]|nr:MAG: transcription elongation factor GreB [Bdellovibrionota bacterium]
MNKAFTKENDSEVDDDLPAPPLPGGKNYITPGGLEKLQAEFSQLKFRERPEVTKVVQWAAGNGDRSENGDYLYGKKRLREIDKRLRYLAKRIESAEVIDPARVRSEQVMFGATVTIRDEDDREKSYTIVGVDEIDVAHGRISWMSPLACALMKARQGDWVTFRSPKGVQQLEVIKIEYVALPPEK